MDLTPPSLTRSPTFSPNTSRSTGSPPAYYPSPTLPGEPYVTSSLLGARASCSMAHPLDQTDQSLPPAPPPQDSRISSDWPPPSIAATTSPSSSATPSALSLEYDPFANYDSPSHASYGHEVYSTHMHGHGPNVLHSPGHNSSVFTRTTTQGSSRAPLSFIHGSNGPKAKTEDQSDYSHSDSPHFSMSQSAYGAEPSRFTGSSHSDYMTEQPLLGWSRVQGHHDQSPYPGSSGQPAGEPETSQSQQQQQSKTAKPRKSQRRLTTREEANYQCDVQGCGKLFSRSYNYKAHLETHDERREYPFPCQVDGCDKRFVRKTDLQRHHQSVHTKERNHRCDYCGRLFARKDTLRRHMEDGCSRRFDLDNLPLRSESYGALPSSQRPAAGPGNSRQPPNGGGTLPPLVMPAMNGNDLTPSMITASTSASRRNLPISIESSNGNEWSR